MKERSWFFQKRIALAKAFLGSDSGKRLLTRAMPEQIELVGIRARGNLFLTRPVDGVARELLRKQEWFATETAHCLDFLQEVRSTQKRCIALEIGAHIGTQTVQLAQSGLFDTVIAVEPLPESYRLLSANILLNDVADRVSAVNCGADITAGSLEVFAHPRNVGASALFPAGDGRQPMGYQVPVRPVADILDEMQIDAADVQFLWLDAEGMEPQILASCLDAGVRPAVTVVEFTPTLYGPERTAQFIEAMSTSFSRVRQLRRDGLYDADWAWLADTHRQVDLVLTP